MLTGKKLLKDTDNYEDYCSKKDLKEFAKIEENLLYLAQKKKLSNREILNIADSQKISEETLIGLYHCGVFTLKKVETYAKQRDMNIEEIKEKIKQQKLKDGEKIDLTNDEEWNLLTPEEKLMMLAKEIKEIDNNKGQKIEERIKEIYSTQQIADLYRELYIEKNSQIQNLEQEEKRIKYENLIKLHNFLGMENKEDIIFLLEEELSNEMLTNLYSDNVINMNILQSYGEKELVIEIFNQGKIHDKDIKKAIIECKILLEEQQINEYYSKGIFTTKDILDLYLEGNVSLDTIRKINENLPEEEKIDLELKEEELTKLYEKARKERKAKKESQDKNIKYKRYGLIYQTLRRENLSEEEKIKSDKKILEGISNISQEDITELYKDNLLTLETVLENGGENLIKKLILNGELRTNDARKYFEAEESKLNIEEILQVQNMDETEKLILIYTTYGDNPKKREELVENYLSAYTTDIKGETTKQKESGNGGSADKKTITDPYQRWKMLSLLDKNYSRKYVGGYLIIKLHNTQKVVIEKMYEKKKGKIVEAYGTATFGLNAEEYEDISKKLEIDGKFNIAEIRRLNKENPERVIKITHHPAILDEHGNEKTSWGKRLLEYICDNEAEKIYTKEEVDKIETCMREIEESRKEIDR